MKRLLFALCILISLTSLAQEPTLTPKEIALTVDSLSAKLNRFYVFPDKAREMSELIQRNLKDGKYASFTDPMAFADRITEDLLSISHDKHIRFRFAPDRVQQMREMELAEEPNIEELKAEAGRQNFGFEEVRILDGNIGYIKLNGFEDAAFAGEAASAAMNLVSYADAIIFDLRENGGGSPSMIQLLSTYLYAEDEQIHLNNFYFRPDDETTQTWTLPYVNGKRNPKAQVYVLTSAYTFSAAEEFTYNLKNLKRAIIVGETTGGGAHPGGPQIIGESFVCFIPIGRAINPISKTNWEGVGVAPDVQTTRENALHKAHYLALDSLRKISTDEMQQHSYDWQMAILKNKMEPYHADPKTFKNYTGKFGPRSLFVENGALFYQREGKPKFELTALSDGVFYSEALEIKIDTEMSGGKIAAILVSTMDGRTERNPKE